MNKLAQWIASLGQSIQFISFFAHFGMAALIVEHFSFGHPLSTLTLILAFATLKEFIFDLAYETSPAQTFTDNLQDWLGWSLGGLCGFGFAVGWW